MDIVGRQEEDDISQDNDPPIMPYATLGNVDVPAKVHKRAIAIYVLGLVWIIVSMASGIASDRVSIPLPKKIALSLCGAICAVLALTSVRDRLLGVRIGFAWLAALMMLVMWFWN